MNPFLLGALGMAPTLIKGIGQVAGGIADAQGAAFGTVPAQDPRVMGQQMVNQSFQNFDPNGQFARGQEQAGGRQSAANFNMQNKTGNEALKRSYVADSYKQALDLSKGAIDNYLQRARTQDQVLGQMAMMRY